MGSEEVLVEVLGRCIGRRSKGRHVIFIDLLECTPDGPDDPFRELPDGDNDDGEVVHNAGEHKRRDVPLRLGPLVPETRVYNVFVALSEARGLSREAFSELALALDPKSIDRLARPRVGDIFRVTANVHDATHTVNGRAVPALNAREIDLVRRGPRARPGDWADKWSFNPETTVAKVGTPVRTSNRFRVFADWCVQRFVGKHVDGGLHVLDIAGGAGKLSTEFVHRGWRSTIIDPRGSHPTRSEVQEWVAALFSISDHAHLVAKADVLVGLHCDGAVDAIVDAAISHSKSFAIVPCCVFPRQYPRTLKSGEAVILRGELYKWIVEQCHARGYHGTVGTEKLSAFDGANVVVYGVAQ